MTTEKTMLPCRNTYKYTCVPEIYYSEHIAPDNMYCIHVIWSDMFAIYITQVAYNAVKFIFFSAYRLYMFVYLLEQLAVYGVDA